MPKINKISVIYTKKSNKNKKTKKNKLKSQIKIKNGGTSPLAALATLGRQAGITTMKSAATLAPAVRTAGRSAAIVTRTVGKQAAQEFGKEAITNASRLAAGRQSLLGTVRHAVSQGSQATHARKPVFGLF
jgi:hypothetical protein